MTIAGCLAGRSKCDALIQGHMIANDTGLSNHHTTAMVNEKICPDLGTGMDIDSGFLLCPKGQKPGQCVMSLEIELVSRKPGIHSPKTGEKQDFQGAFQRWITLFDRFNL